MAGGRKPVPFRLTNEAHIGLDRLATRHGTTMTTIIEALGVMGYAGREIVWTEVLAEARRLDAERRNRMPSDE